MAQKYKLLYFRFNIPGLRSEILCLHRQFLAFAVTLQCEGEENHCEVQKFIVKKFIVCEGKVFHCEGEIIDCN